MDALKLLAMAIGFLCLVESAYAYGCSGTTVWWTFNDADHSGTTAQDSCGVQTNGTESAITTGSTCMWSQCYNFDAVTDAVYNTSTSEPHFTGHTNASWGAWINYTTGTASSQFIVDECNVAATGKFELYVDSNEYACCYIQDDGAHNINVCDNTATNNGQWHHAVCTYDGTNHNLTIWVNATYQNSATNVNVDTNIYSANSRYSAGAAWDSASTWVLSLRGLIDEPFLYNGLLLSPAQLSNLYTVNDLVTPSVPLSVVLSSPADNDHDNASFPGTWWFTPSWNNTNVFSNCTLWAGAAGNASYLGYNTTLGNLTNTSISWAPSVEGTYVWYVSCLDNATVATNSSNFTFYYDINAPTININSPTGAGTYYYGDSITKNGTFMDNIALFNCSEEIYYDNGTLFDEDNVLCSGTSLVWANQTFTPYALGNWSAYYSATDSHTANRNPVKVIKNDATGTEFENPGKGKFKAQAGVVGDKESYMVSYTELSDRIKWNITMSKKTSAKDWDITIPLVSDCPIYVIKDSGYHGHGVTCGAWFDFEDAYLSGWAVTLSASGNTASIRLIRSFPSAEKTVLIDPATGGLNFGSTHASFTVVDDSGLDVNVSGMSAGIEGYLYANFFNISTNALITAATCTMNITDPYGNVTASNMSEMAAYYIGAYTPLIAGVYSYTVWCNKTGWHPENESANFTVLASAPTTSFVYTVDSGEYQYKNCTDNITATWWANKTITTGGYSQTFTERQDVYCPYGCIEGKCRISLVDPESWEMNWIGAAFVGAFIICVVLLISKNFRWMRRKLTGR